MTKVVVIRRNGSIAEIECDGHTGYGVEGEDIVCAALSSIVQTALLGVLTVAQVNVDYARDDKRGWMRFALPEDMSAAEKLACDHILETMMLGVLDLNQGFSDFIELEVR